MVRRRKLLGAATGRLSTALVGSALMIGLGLGVGAQSKAQVALDGYILSDFRVSLEAPDVHELPTEEKAIRIEYAIAWETNEFPGWRSCTFQVLTQDGVPIAEKTLELFDLTPEPSQVATLVNIPTSLLEAGPPERVDVNCLPGRLDDPNGSYSFSDIAVDRRPLSPTDLRTFAVTVDTRWQGAGIPSPQECQIDVYGREGRLFTSETNFVDGSGQSSGLELTIQSDQDITAEPITAEISCQPLTQGGP